MTNGLLDESVPVSSLGNLGIKKDVLRSIALLGQHVA